jgi:DUF4097 and DUF4098 domain-containing protein YvlB
MNAAAPSRPTERRVPMIRLRRCALSLLALLLAVPAAAQVYPDRVATTARARSAPGRFDWQQNRGRETETERTTRTLKVGANGAIDLQNISGDIIVTRGSGSDAQIEIVKTARAASQDEARQALTLVQVDISERGPRVEIRTRYPDNDDRTRNRRNLNVSVAYTVQAPAGVQIVAHTISGNVSVRDISGEIAAETVSGDVTIANASRISTAKTVSGTVRITSAMLDTALEAGSVSGDVLLTKARATRLSLSTVSGNVVADDVECPRVEMEAVSGRIEYKGPLASGGRYELTSHSGDVRLTVAGDTGFEVTANSFSGSVRSDLPLTLRGSGDDRRGRQRSLRGVYGNGSAVLDLTTFSGSIVIAK